ncbi:MAG: hypothetical protein Q8P22_07945 [Chloroflexota bacterium]|nr:hypothetical protein [Chloroflexota bacterium]
MGKLSPGERWRRHVMERFVAFERSGELARLRAKGLAVLRRKKLLTGDEWNSTFEDRVRNPEYLRWHEECTVVGKRFGLAPWTVYMACLLEGYRPEEQLHVMEAEWPKVRIVTEVTDPLFLSTLAREAQGLGLYVVSKQGASETTHLFVSSQDASELQPPAVKPPMHAAFKVRVETPLEYPPEAARGLQQEASRLGKELLRRLGYSVPTRLRASSLVDMADVLKVGEAPLPRSGAYDIVDEVHGEGELGQDQQRWRSVISRRHKLKKRLVEPYAKDTEGSGGEAPPGTSKGPS